MGIGDGEVASGPMPKIFLVLPSLIGSAAVPGVWAAPGGG